MEIFVWVFCVLLWACVALAYSSAKNRAKLKLYFGKKKKSQTTTQTITRATGAYGVSTARPESQPISKKYIPRMSTEVERVGSGLAGKWPSRVRYTAPRSEEESEVFVGDVPVEALSVVIQSACDEPVMTVQEPQTFSQSPSYSERDLSPDHSSYKSDSNIPSSYGGHGASENNSSSQNSGSSYGNSSSHNSHGSNGSSHSNSSSHDTGGSYGGGPTADSSSVSYDSGSSYSGGGD